jgi:DNA-binding transcriptional LysR family regulator
MIGLCRRFQLDEPGEQEDAAVELYQLKTFVTVAREGHMTRAAQRLHTSQPSVSAHVRALEEELGVTLFVRTSKGMQLTREGCALREKAEKALATIDAIRLQASELKDSPRGTFRLGLHIDPQFLRIDRFLSFMRHHYPGIDFYLLQKLSWEQTDALRTGELDAGFVYGRPESKEQICIVLRTFNITVAGPVEWQARLSGATWQQIAAMPWIWTPSQCAFCDIAMAAFQSRGLEPLKVTVADQEPVIRTLVRSGLGLAIMIEEEAVEARSRGEAAVWDRGVGAIELSFVYRRARDKDPLLKAVLNGIHDSWPDENKR